MAVVGTADGAGVGEKVGTQPRMVGSQLPRRMSSKVNTLASPVVELKYNDRAMPVNV